MHWGILLISILVFLGCDSRPMRPILSYMDNAAVGESEQNPDSEDSEEDTTDSSTPDSDSNNSPSSTDVPATTTPETTTPETTTPETTTPDTKTPETSTPETPKTKESLKLENGIYTIRNYASKKCLEVSSADKGTAILQFGCNGSRIQAFRIESVGQNEFKIVNIDSKKAFELKSSSKADGGLLDQGDYANGENQAFLIDYDAASDSLVNIRPKHSGKFLEIPGASVKSKVQPQQRSESKTDNQRWVLTKIKEPTSPSGVRYYFVNECSHDVWVGSQNNPNYPVVKGDFKLAPGASNSTDTPAQWEGRFWGRYNCKVENGKFTCESAQCAKGEICGDVYGEPPASLAEFRTRGYEDIDFYDISLVDGSNLPMDIRPMPLTLKADGAAGSCKHLECKSDLRLDCPAELQKKNAAGVVIGCRSACDAFKTDEYCCLGAYKGANCKPTKYSKWFDAKCPDTYSFAEDVKTFSCRNADYEVIFCPK